MLSPQLVVLLLLSPLLGLPVPLLLLLLVVVLQQLALLLSPLLPLPPLLLLQLELPVLLLPLRLAVVVFFPPRLGLPLLPGRWGGREEWLAAAAMGEGVRSAGQGEGGSGKLLRKRRGTPAQR